MEEVFSTAHLPRAKRYDAWRSAICDHYVYVDVTSDKPEEYQGFIREARFGDVMLTDILLSEQTIRRNTSHISKLDKDCYYLQFLHSGKLNVVQRGDTFLSNPAMGAIFCATEQYELHCSGDVRSFYLEIPRDDFARRFPSESVPITAPVDSTRGLGRIATEFCAMLATESNALDDGNRTALGGQLMDILALALLSAGKDAPMNETSVRQARLRSIKRWIDEHIGEHDLPLDLIAAANGVSVRYLHQLFEDEDMTVSKWLWDRRLQLCYSEVAKADGRSITSIAFDHGFSSSAHFSRSFRRKFGAAPRDIARNTPRIGRGPRQDGR